jgi:hypothetical protein
LSVSSAYSISFSVASIFGIGMNANSPKRPGWSARALIAYSLTSRVNRWASSVVSRGRLRPVGNESTAVATPARSICSSPVASFHCWTTGGLRTLAFRQASSSQGG